MREDQHVPLVQVLDQPAGGQARGQVAGMVRRDTVVEPARVNVDRHADVLGAKAPRRGDQPPVVHLPRTPCLNPSVKESLRLSRTRGWAATRRSASGRAFISPRYTVPGR